LPVLKKEHKNKITTKLNPTPNDTVVKVPAHNYVRAESDLQMRDYVEKFNCFGEFVHVREPYDVNNQVINWLPAPKDGFRFAARFYGPFTPLIDGSYNMPGVVRVE